MTLIKIICGCLCIISTAYGDIAPPGQNSYLPPKQPGYVYDKPVRPFPTLSPGPTFAPSKPSFGPPSFPGPGQPPFGIPKPTYSPSFPGNTPPGFPKPPLSFPSGPGPQTTRPPFPSQPQKPIFPHSPIGPPSIGPTYRPPVISSFPPFQPHPPTPTYKPPSFPVQPPLKPTYGPPSQPIPSGPIRPQPFPPGPIHPQYPSPTYGPPSQPGLPNFPSISIPGFPTKAPTPPYLPPNPVGPTRPVGPPGHIKPFPPGPNIGTNTNSIYPNGHHGGESGEHDHHHHHEPGMPFDFNYAINEPAYGNEYSHNAISDGDTTNGEYKVLLPDGRTQITKYRANWATGFHAQVRYEGNPTYPNYPGASGIPSRPGATPIGPSGDNRPGYPTFPGYPAGKPGNEFPTGKPLPPALPSFPHFPTESPKFPPGTGRPGIGFPTLTPFKPNPSANGYPSGQIGVNGGNAFPTTKPVYPVAPGFPSISTERPGFPSGPVTGYPVGKPGSGFPTLPPFKPNPQQGGGFPSQRPSGFPSRSPNGIGFPVNPSDTGRFPGYPYEKPSKPFTPIPSTPTFPNKPTTGGQQYDHNGGYKY